MFRDREIDKLAVPTRVARRSVGPSRRVAGPPRGPFHPEGFDLSNSSFDLEDRPGSFHSDAQAEDEQNHWEEDPGYQEHMFGGDDFDGGRMQRIHEEAPHSFGVSDPDVHSEMLRDWARQHPKHGSRTAAGGSSPSIWGHDVPHGPVGKAPIDRWNDYDKMAEEELHRRHQERGGEGNADPREFYRPLGKVASALTKQARTFLAEQNTNDRSELLYRARRHAATQTSTWSAIASQRATEAFCARVAELIPSRSRTAAAQPVTHVADFDDQLLY